MGESLICFVLNSICCLLYKREYQRFKGTGSIEKVQNKKLFDILRANKSCEYGKKYDFGSIQSVEEYQQRLPLTTYEDYTDYIECIKNGEKNILTSEDVLLLEPTSGSASPSKLIPYTSSLKKEFQMGIRPWIYNLYTTCKGVKWGKSYWSITPVTDKMHQSAGGIPIGFEEDGEYFGRIEQKLLDKIFALPSHAVRGKSMDEFYRTTAVSLLGCKSLSLISVWNPTYLLLILEYMQENAEELIKALTQKNRKRAVQVKRDLAQKAYDKLWPQLKVISCWCDANAEPYGEKLKCLFPGVTIQPKGLLATEGFVSFPFVGENGSRLSVHSHFFEFLSLSDERIYLAHQLEKGKKYAIILTTSGGLYRYKLNDIVEVIGHKGVFPLTHFRGKMDKVSDLFGEKLNETFLKNVIEKSGVSPEFYMFAPERDRYVLYIKADTIPADVEEALRGNFHYDYCRKLGQLKELKYFRLLANPEKEYMEECVRRGQRLGDIKPAVLSLHGNWDQVFEGEYI